MKRTKRWGLSWLLAGLLVGCGTVSTLPAPTTSPKQEAMTLVPTNQVIAVVGNQKILGAQLNGQYRFYEWVYGRPFPVSTYYEKEMITKDILLNELLPAVALKRGIRVTAKEISTQTGAFEQMLATRVYNGSRVQLEHERAFLHISDSDLAQFIRSTLLDAKLENALVTKIAATQVQAYYDAHPSSFTIVTLNQIVVHSKKQADGIRQMLQDGQSFASLARTYSTDAGSRAQGGFYANVLVATLVPSVASEVMNLPLGEISQPIHSPYGYHLIRVDDRSVQPFLSVAASVALYLLQSARQTSLDQLIRSIQAQDSIRFTTI